MITSFRHSEDIDKHIIKTPLDHTASWINVVEPDREEIENLMEQYNIPEDFIRDPLDSEESSRIEYDEDTGYYVLTGRQFNHSYRSIFCNDSIRHYYWQRY